jgi:hypothetical protein
MHGQMKALKPQGKFNRDIDPSPLLVSEFPALAPVIVNPDLSQAFWQHEHVAVRCKRLYVLLGRTALICIFLTMVFFDYEFTLQRVYGVSIAARVLGVAVAALGVGAQFWLIIGRIKEKWLIERFAAERLRCLKFQAFTLVPVAATPTQLASDVAAFTRKGIARLEQELLGGRSALYEFLPELVVPRETRDPSATADVIRDAFRVYESLRLEVQAQHFETQARVADERARFPSTISEITFALGGILACGQIGATAWSALNGFRTVPIPDTLQPWLAFFTLLLFVLSAVLAVYQRGSGDEPHYERYKHYAREIGRIRMNRDPESTSSFLDTVSRVERIEWRELYEFCRDGMRSNYIF